jgi:hypothetical protein
MARLSIFTINGMDRDWLKARRALLKSVKEDVRHRLGKLPDELISYETEAKKMARGRFRISSKSEVMAEVESADLVYGGDFHAHGPAQRTHFKILRHLAPERPVVLALECFDFRSQKFIDLFLAGRLDVEKLKKRVKWDEQWGFPFENYKSLIELARRRGWRIQAIGLPAGLTAGSGGLDRQDQMTAKMIKKTMLNSPNALIYILIGELHLTHLPEKVRKEFRAPRKLREVAIHINTESVYFQLAAKGLEHSVDVIRYGSAAKKARVNSKNLNLTRFCVLSSPPWVPWQSYLLHLDKSMELEWTDSGETEEDFDPTDHVKRLASWIASDLGFSLKSDSLSDLAVYSASDAKLWRKIESTHEGHAREFARRLMVKGYSFMLPSAGVGCLAQMTVNHAAHLASEYLQMKVSGRKRELWRFPKDFQAAILVEALAYFGSKQVNHKRQAETFSDLRTELQTIQPTDEGRDALRLALDQRMSELVYFHQGRKRKSLVKPAKSASYLEAALILGRMMGERLYVAYLARKISKREIVRLFKIDVLARDFSREYDETVYRLARVVGTEIAHGGVLPSRTRRERI